MISNLRRLTIEKQLLKVDSSYRIARGLRIEDVELRNGIISVKRSSWEGTKRTPKTRNTVRKMGFDVVGLANCGSRSASERSGSSAGRASVCGFAAFLNRDDSSILPANVSRIYHGLITREPISK